MYPSWSDLKVQAVARQPDHPRLHDKCCGRASEYLKRFWSPRLSGPGYGSKLVVPRPGSPKNKLCYEQVCRPQYVRSSRSDGI